MNQSAQSDQRVNRRRQRRVPFDRDVTWYGGGEKTLKAINLSVGGICVSGVLLDPGTSMEISFEVPGYDLEIFAEAMVEWTNAPELPGYDPKRPTGMGLMFVDIDPEQNKILHAYMAGQTDKVPDSTIEDLLKDELHTPPPGPSHGRDVPTGLDSIDSILDSIVGEAEASPAPVPAPAPLRTAPHKPVVPAASAKPAAAPVPARAAPLPAPADATAPGSLATEAATTVTAAKAPAAAKPAAPPAAGKAPAAAPKPAAAPAAAAPAAAPVAAAPAAAVPAAAKAAAAPKAPAPADTTVRTVAPEAAPKPAAPPAAAKPVAAPAPEPAVAPAAAPTLEPAVAPAAAKQAAPTPEPVVAPAAAKQAAAPPEPAPAAAKPAAPQRASATAGAKAPVAVAERADAGAAPAWTPRQHSDATQVRPADSVLLAQSRPGDDVGNLPELAIEFDAGDSAAAPGAAAGSAAQRPKTSGATPQPWFGAEEPAPEPPAASVEVDDHADRLPQGTVLGNFRIVRWLGSGGMGDVYQAQHVSIGRSVAIKVLRAEIATNRLALRRFFDEARSVNRIQHENIVEITDFVTHGRHTFCVMEYLDGETLAALQVGGGLPLARTLRIGVQVCSALQAVHNAGIVHRDLKPQNIMLIERAGQPAFVKLLDFGIAKLKEIDEGAKKKGSSSLGHTTGSMLLGTPAYMAPEQLLGGAVDHRADIYAFGVILYQMVTGVNPFLAETWGQAVVKHVTEPPPVPTRYTSADRVPPALEEVILDCLSKQADGRPQQIAEVGAKLAQFEQIVLKGGNFPKPKKAVAAGGDRPAKGRRGLVFALGSVSLVAAAAAAVVIVGPSNVMDRVKATTARFAGTPVEGAVSAKAPPAKGEKPAVAAAAPAAAAPAAEPTPAAEPPVTGAAAAPAAAAVPPPAEPEPRVVADSKGGRNRKTKAGRPGREPEAPAPVAAAAEPKAKPAAPPPPAAAPAPAPAPAAEPAGGGDTAQAHFDEAKKLLKESKALLAIDELKKAVALNPRHAPSYLLMGKAYAAVGREPLAIEMFEKFIKLDPDHKDAEKIRGIIAAFRGTAP